MTFSSTQNLRNEIFKMLKENAVSQTVDIYGKLRVIHYPNISLVTPPYAAYKELKQTNVEEHKLIETTLQNAQEFAKEEKMEIVSQYYSPTEKKTKGVWLQKSPLCPSFYIPVDSDEKLPNVELSFLKTPPWVIPRKSILDNYQYFKQITNILKQYTLWWYSVNQPIPMPEFRKLFVIRPDFIYRIELLDKKYLLNDVMFFKKKLVVLSQEIQNRLITHLKANLLNQHDNIIDLKNQTYIQNYYTTLSEFQKCNASQLIFQGRLNIRRWKYKQVHPDATIKTFTHYLTNISHVEPYFHKNPHIFGGKVHLIQNVANYSLERSLTVSSFWNQKKINLGYDFLAKIPEGQGYTIFESGNEENPVVHPGKNQKEIFVVEYKPNYYAALLFLSVRKVI